MHGYLLRHTGIDDVDSTLLALFILLQEASEGCTPVVSRKTSVVYCGFGVRVRTWVM